MTLPELIQEHFDGVLDTIDGGRWGKWVLDQDRLDRGELVLRHEAAGFTVTADAPGEWPSSWIDEVANAGWASADDVGNLVFAIRDLEYARWLGVLPGSRAVTATNAERGLGGSRRSRE